MDAKRFWKETSVVPSGDGFAIHLDTKPVRTPAKSELYLPTRALAEAVAAEWEAQGDRIDALSMPQTRYANSVIDGVAPRRAEVVNTVAAYGGSDLLCYRAAHPTALVERQTERWDPLLDWARDRYDAPLMQVQGVMPISQPERSVVNLGEAVEAHDDFELAALHDLVAISGSLVLGLAVSDGHLAPEAALALSRLDDDWQIEQWGEDAEAAKVAQRKAGEFAQAARLLTLVRDA